VVDIKHNFKLHAQQTNLGSGNVPGALVFGSQNFPLWLGERSPYVIKIEPKITYMEHSHNVLVWFPKK